MNNLTAIFRKFIRITPIFLTLMNLAGEAQQYSTMIPQTGTPLARECYLSSLQLARAEFIRSVSNGDSASLTGLWLPGIAGLKVEPQPAGEYVFITDLPATVNHFQLAEAYGSIGLLAHAEHAGTFFHQLVQNQHISLIYGDGSIVDYKIQLILEYQAIDPFDQQTDFMARDGTRVTQKDLFNSIYSQPGRLVLQTCIIKGSENLWGRKFIIAETVRR